MNKNINKQDLIDNLVDDGNISESENRICTKFNDHFSNGRKEISEEGTKIMNVESYSHMKYDHIGDTKNLLLKKQMK